MRHTRIERTITDLPEPYKSKGRSWIKLWVPEWLDGTTRYEMSGAQRAFWVDLLTMAGRSRIPGYVCAGDNKGQLFGYPLARYVGILNDSSVDVLQTLRLFEMQGKIQVIVTRTEEPALYAVKIQSWSKYQSEYMRQKASRSKTQEGAPNVTPKSTTRCAVEGEVEGEVEAEGDKEKIKTIAQQNALSDFDSFWAFYPKKVGKPAAKKAWRGAHLKSEEVPLVAAGLSKWMASWTDRQFIPYPATWLNQRRWEDEPPKSAIQETHDAIKRASEKYA